MVTKSKAKPKNKKKTELILVECVEMFRMRYLCEVPEGKPDYAIEKVNLRQAKEFSQQYLGEMVVSHKHMTELDALILCDLDNDYSRSWTDEHKKEVFFTKENERYED